MKDLNSESVRLIIPYDNVDTIPSKLSKAISAIIILVVLAIIIGAIIATTATEASSVESIKLVCTVTQRPESCFHDISSFNSHDHIMDPEIILNLTLHLALNELANISIDLGDCQTMFDDALNQLSILVESMIHVKDNVLLLADAKVADLETCVGSLKEMGSMDVDEVTMKVQRSRVYMSYSLAILANMELLLQRFGVHLHLDSSY